MSVIAEMVHHKGMNAEWKRIEILAQCLLESRSGKEPSKALLAQLESSHSEVEYLRKEQSNWNDLAIGDLPNLALDMMACIYAPSVNPNVALLYQDLQQSNSICPTLAFLHRLLALNDREYSIAQQLAHNQGLLVTRALMHVEGEGPMTQLKPHSAVLTKLSGLPRQRLHIPGAVKIDVEADWDDLVIQTQQKRMLQEYLLWIYYANKIVQDWGARPLGGPIALFSGPSGTGKTFAASVIANELRWPLYRVDLGALISKYIGETEKNLNALFEATQGQKLLLQFDEVDALMGKRGEIKDARDRYANMEVSHLLSRIEQHQGPCILTTNLSKQIDSAFQRRFHFSINFPRPELKERLALWRCLLPKNAPLAKELDLQKVAEATALCGGEIRNAAMHAAILAASESKSINMQHISIGVWRVLQKADGNARLNQLRQMAVYLPKEIVTGEIT